MGHRRRLDLAVGSSTLTDLLISLIKIKDRCLLVTRGVSDGAVWQELSGRRLCDRGYASCENGRRRREEEKRVRIFLSHVEVPLLTVGPNVGGKCEPAHIGGCKFLRSTA